MLTNAMKYVGIGNQMLPSAGRLVGCWEVKIEG